MADESSPFSVGSNKRLSHQRNMKNVGTRELKKKGEPVVQVGPDEVTGLIPDIPSTFTALMKVLEPHDPKEQKRLLDAAQILLGF